MSASNTHTGELRLEKIAWICSRASQQDLKRLNPCENGSESTSATGSSACCQMAYIARSYIVGIPNIRLPPLFFGMYTRRKGCAL